MTAHSHFHEHLGRALPGTWAILLIAVAGCASEPVRRCRIKQIEMAQLAAEVAEPPQNVFAIHRQAETTGRFPCSLAVIRVTSAPVTNRKVAPEDATVGGADTPTDLVLDLLPDEQAVPWIELCDNFPAITAVNVMGRPAVTFESVTLDQLIAAGREQHAAVVLVYGQSDLPGFGRRVRMLGALYDTATSALLATVSARVEPVPGLPVPSDRIEQDKRHEDAGVQTAIRFRALVLECLVDLAAMDAPATTTQPNPWGRPEVRPMLSPWTDTRSDRHTP